MKIWMESFQDLCSHVSLKNVVFLKFHCKAIKLNLSGRHPSMASMAAMPWVMCSHKEAKVITID